MFLCHIFLLFHTVHVNGVLTARILEWFAFPSSSGPRFIRTLHYDLSIEVALHRMAYSFIELHKPLCLDKAVMHERALHTKPSKMTPSLSLVLELLNFINSVLKTRVLRDCTCF